MGGAPQGGPPPESEPPPGYAQWTGPSPMMQHPFGAYVSWPPLRGGYSKPINLSQMHYKAGGKVPLDVTTTNRERTPEQLT
jgi:hypothetical protein